MTISVRQGGTWREVKIAYVRTGGAWREVKEAFARTGGAWRSLGTAAPAMTVNAVPSSIEGTPNQQTSATTAFVSGGEGPYTYSWQPTRLTNITATTPNARSTRFFADREGDATFICTVSDASGNQVVSNTVRVVYVADLGGGGGLPQ